jgi:hypothetical protein
MSSSPNPRAPEYKDAAREAQPVRQSNERTVVPTPQARQGVTGHNVRYVLGFSIAAVVVAFAIVYLVYV